MMRRVLEAVVKTSHESARKQSLNLATLQVQDDKFGLVQCISCSNNMPLNIIPGPRALLRTHLSDLAPLTE